MDGNGNNSSKVSTLRQHFENYDKIEQRKPSLVAATIFQPISTSSQSPPSSLLVVASTKSSVVDLKTAKVKSANSGQLVYTSEKTSGSSSRKSIQQADVETKVIRSKTSSDIKSFAHGLVDNSPSSNLQRSASEKDLLMSVSLTGGTTEGCSRRNGIYISNSLRFEDESDSTPAAGVVGASLEKNKRRGVVLVDNDIVSVHHHRHHHNHHRSQIEHHDDIEFVAGEDDDDIIDMDDDDLDEVEQDDDPAVETSIPISFDRHDEVLGDGSSIASNSTTSSHRSFHGFSSSSTKNRHGSNILDSITGSSNNAHLSRNDGMMIGAEAENKNDKGIIMSGGSSSNNNGSNSLTGGGGMRDSGSKANTPTSSSSCSSGSGACGKVKRRNAFRHKDVSSFPTAAAAGDGTSSAVLAAVAKTKVAVERVKSLDSATTSSNVTSQQNTSQQNNNQSGLNSSLLNTTRKSVSNRSSASPNLNSSYTSSSSNNNNNSQEMRSSGMVGCGGASESSKKKDGIVHAGGINNPHELMVTSNNNSSSNNNKGSPAQRAASLCVRTSNPNNSSLRSSSQMYEPGAGGSAFARNNNNNNNGSNSNKQPAHNLQQLHHHQLYQQQNCNNGKKNNASNNQLVGNAPDNLVNNSINQNNSSSQRVVNVVTPYQVTDIYNQLKISDSSSSPVYPTNNNNGSSNSKQPQQLKQILNEVEYAVPMVQQSVQQQQRFPQQQKQPKQQQHIPQKIPVSEIPPKVPPPPLNYPPSSIRKEQFGLPSPNSSYSFLPHRNSLPPPPPNVSQGPFPSNSSSGGGGSKRNVGRKEVVASAAIRTTDNMKKGAAAAAAYGPPEKPPRTFLYNQAVSGPSTRHPQQAQYKKLQKQQEQQVVIQQQQNVSKTHHVKQSTTSASRNKEGFYGSNNGSGNSTNSPAIKGQVSSNSNTSSSSVNLNSSSSGSSIGGGSSAGAIGLPSLSSQAKRQHSSSSSSSTLTSGTAATIVNNYRQQMSPSSSFKSQQESSGGPTTNNVPSVITTTPALQRKTMGTLEQSEGVYSSRGSTKKRDDKANCSSTKGGTPESSRTSKSSSTSSALRQSSHSGGVGGGKNHNHNHHHHHHIHPPLVRSKTESQLVVKSKSNASRFLNRPSDGVLDYGVEMMSLDQGRQHSHYHQDLLVDATNPNATFSHGAPSYYGSNGPPVHHQSQTNLMTLTSNKIYEQQQYRSISNLLRYANNNGSAGVNYNKYPSNPGLHYASRELSWLDNGLPPVSSMVNTGSNYNLYSSGDNQNTRHSSLLYTTNIDISSEDHGHVKPSSVRQALTFSDNSSPVDLLQQQQQQQQQNSLYGIKTSDNSPSVRHQSRNNGGHCNNNLYVHHPLYQYRLSERSKSEWALNAVHHSGTGGGSGGANGGNGVVNSNQFRGINNNSGSNNGAFGFNSTNSTTSNASSSHRQLTSSNSRINTVGNNTGLYNTSCDGSNNPVPPTHLASRRATVAIAGSGQGHSNMPGGAASLNSTGHPSLDSSMTSQHHSGNTPKGHRQQQQQHGGGGPSSIQHLVNQLFSTSTIKEATSSTDSGIQLGSESLSSCDTPIGDSTTDTGDSDCENDGDTSNNAREVVEARKGYVRRVSSVRVQELGESLHRLIQSSKIAHNADPLFECLVVVGLDRDPKNGIYHPYITEKFPRDAKLAEGVEEFCFPDSYEWPCHEGSTAQFYTLAITDQRGGRKFGCCFRILPEGANFCIPITYCIISSHRAIGFYREVLREITACHGHSQYHRRHILQELYKKSFPAPGSSISLTEPTIEETYMQNEHVGYGSLTGSPPKSVTIRRRADHRLDEGDLVTLVSTVDLSIVIKLFGSLLLERKVVLLSRALSTLSLCVEALESLLYPFNWQHTFVPILPLNMPDVIDAPAPFLIGVLRSSRTAWDKTLDDGIVVDLDAENGKIISCVGDEGTILPKRIHRKLRNALSQLVLDLADQKDSTKNVLISECFIRMFVETLGHYSNHIVTKPDGTRVFEREGFVKAAESKATQNFLEWFSETSMFNEFIEVKLKNTHQHGLFEQRVMEQIESGPIVHGSGSSGTPLKKDLWIKMKGPFGTWLKETFK